MTAKPPRPIVILGPTAGGKSELAVGLAEAVGGQVIGADSMQVYRHLDAGTAKPSRGLRQRVRHHLIDIVEPTERFTVADWLGRADPLVAQIQDSNHHAVIVGGTNLYLKALLEGLFEGPPGNPAVRQQFEGVSGLKLHERLGAVDPESARRIHPNDRKKLVRALEVYQMTGKPISGFQRQWNSDTTRPYRHNPILIGLAWSVEQINRRINQRVKVMFYPGQAACESQTHNALNKDADHIVPESLPEEVARLQRDGLMGDQVSQALGYKQVICHFQGHDSVEQAFEKTKIATRRFAKNQRTWLRRFREVKWIAVDHDQPTHVLKEAIKIVKAEK